MIALAALFIGPVPSNAQPACASPVRFIPGTGLACPAATGGFLVRLADGSLHLTHGPDKATIDLPRAQPQRNLPASPSSACVDPATHHHVEIYYGYLAKAPNRHDQMVAEIRSQFTAADTTWLDSQSIAKHGPREHLYVSCDSNNLPTIGTVHLSATVANDDNLRFESIVNDMQRDLHVNPLAHYWVFVDGATSMSFGGQSYVGGSLATSDAAGIENPNNIGPGYSVNYGRTGWNGGFIFAHENAHAMGAVQPSAPHATSGYHCTDGYDVMCYDDGSPQGKLYNTKACSSYVFDCSGDDYFNPKPAPGSFLSNHWNLADPANLWIKVG
ncbi:MAG: hypothetical protein NVSMB57_01990 [Actinomycetota bacterium]